MYSDFIRNVAIIAHVEHGKTTLADQLLYQSGMFRTEELVEICPNSIRILNKLLKETDRRRQRGKTGR